MIRGLDVSHWQDRHRFTAAAVKGYAPQFGVAKATEGMWYKDPAFRSNMNIFQSINTPVLGAYHYLRGGNIIGQLDNFMSVVKDPRGMIIQLDVEHPSVKYQDVVEWVGRWKGRTDDYPVFIYTGDWFWQGHKFGDGGILGPLWAAPNRGYVGNKFRNADWLAGYGGWSKLTIAQYSANPALGDMNYFNGSLADLINHHTRGGQGAPQVPPGSETHLYVVVPMDTLRVVAHKTYGNEELWKVIYEHNITLLESHGFNGLDHPADADLPDELVLYIPEIAPPPPVVVVRKYTVHRGDSLSSIARLFYHDPQKWRRIYNANRKRIGSNPSLIQPGWVLNIP